MGLQYLELGFTFYQNYIPYASILLFITLASAFFATRGHYRKRVALYNSVRQRHLVPMVISGSVRYCSCCAEVPICSLLCCLCLCLAILACVKEALLAAQHCSFDACVFRCCAQLLSFCFDSAGKHL